MTSSTVHKINKIKIVIQKVDHQPPHFHVFGADVDFSASIETFEIIAGTYHRKAKNIMEWAKNNQTVLTAKWEEYHG